LADTQWVLIISVQPQNRTFVARFRVTFNFLNKFVGNCLCKHYNGAMTPLTRSIRYVTFALGLMAAAAGAKVTAAELLVIEQDDCPYCKKFHREIAQAYPKTAEGRCAPLRLLDLHEPWPEQYSHIPVQRFTPTFILVSDNQEIDRLVGYPGDEHFWFLIGEMLQKLPTEQKCELT